MRTVLLLLAIAVVSCSSDNNGSEEECCCKSQSPINLNITVDVDIRYLKPNLCPDTGPKLKQCFETLHLYLTNNNDVNLHENVTRCIKMIRSVTDMLSNQKPPAGDDARSGSDYAPSKNPSPTTASTTTSPKDLLTTLILPSKDTWNEGKVKDKMRVKGIMSYDSVAKLSIDSRRGDDVFENRGSTNFLEEDAKVSEEIRNDPPVDEHEENPEKYSLSKMHKAILKSPLLGKPFQRKYKVKKPLPRVLQSVENLLLPKLGDEKNPEKHSLFKMHEAILKLPPLGYTVHNPFTTTPGEIEQPEANFEDTTAPETDFKHTTDPEADFKDATDPEADFKDATVPEHMEETTNTEFLPVADPEMVKPNEISEEGEKQLIGEDSPSDLDTYRRRIKRFPFMAPPSQFRLPAIRQSKLNFDLLQLHKGSVQNFQTKGIEVQQVIDLGQLDDPMIRRGKGPFPKPYTGNVEILTSQKATTTTSNQSKSTTPAESSKEGSSITDFSTEGSSTTDLSTEGSLTTGLLTEESSITDLSTEGNSTAEGFSTEESSTTVDFSTESITTDNSLIGKTSTEASRITRKTPDKDVKKFSNTGKCKLKKWKAKHACKSLGKNIVLLHSKKKHPVSCDNLYKAKDFQTPPSIVFTGDVSPAVGPLTQATLKDKPKCVGERPKYTGILTSENQNGTVEVAWMIQDVDGCDLLRRRSKFKQVKGVEYIPPEFPRNSTEVKRAYIFTLYKNSPKTNIKETMVNKKDFNMNQFAKLSNLCGPKAITKYTVKSPYYKQEKTFRSRKEKTLDDKQKKTSENKQKKTSKDKEVSNKKQKTSKSKQKEISKDKEISKKKHKTSKNKHKKTSKDKEVSKKKQKTFKKTQNKTSKDKKKKTSKDNQNKTSKYKQKKTSKDIQKKTSKDKKISKKKKKQKTSKNKQVKTSKNKHKKTSKNKQKNASKTKKEQVSKKKQKKTSKNKQKTSKKVKIPKSTLPFPEEIVDKNSETQKMTPELKKALELHEQNRKKSPFYDFIVENEKSVARHKKYPQYDRKDPRYDWKYPSYDTKYMEYESEYPSYDRKYMEYESEYPSYDRKYMWYESEYQPYDRKYPVYDRKYSPYSRREQKMYDDTDAYYSQFVEKGPYGRKFK